MAHALYGERGRLAVAVTPFAMVGVMGSEYYLFVHIMTPQGGGNRVSSRRQAGGVKNLSICLRRMNCR